MFSTVCEHDITIPDIKAIRRYQDKTDCHNLTQQIAVAGQKSVINIYQTEFESILYKNQLLLTYIRQNLPHLKQHRNI